MAVPEVERKRDVTRGALIFIAVLLGAFALKLTSPLTAPLAFAFFSALVLQPLRARVARRMPRRLRWVGIAAAVMLLVLALCVLGGAIGLAIVQATQELPKHADRLGAMLQPIRSWAEQHGIEMGGGQSAVPGAAQGGAAALRAVSGAVGFIVLSVFFVVLMLSEVGEWRKKLVRVLHADRVARVLDAASASESSVRRYLVAPVVEGKGTKLSPLVVLAAVTFWGWAWGAVGALLAVPMTVSLMMLCARIPSLERVAVLLGGDADQTT